jgi:hypothetical protein
VLHSDYGLPNISSTQHLNESFGQFGNAVPLGFSVLDFSLQNKNRQ